jgi:hypothetical protein
MTKPITAASEQIKDLMDKLQETLSTHEYCVKSEIKGFVRGMLWELVMTDRTEPRLESDIDDVIDTIFETSKYTDRDDGENYVTWDDKKVMPAIKRIREALIKKGFDKSITMEGYRFK